MKNQSIENLVSYKKGFLSMKIITISAIVGSLIFATVVYIKSEDKVLNAQNQIYLISNSGDITSANKSLLTDDIREYEHKDHIVDATILINQYDEGTLDPNLEKASYYFGDCFEGILRTFDNKRIKQQLQEQNIYTTVTISPDSVTIDYSQTPFKGTVNYLQIYKKAGVNSVNKLYNTIEFTIEDLITNEDFSRSNKNPHGVKIISWQLINSELIN